MQFDILYVVCRNTKDIQSDSKLRGWFYILRFEQQTFAAFEFQFSFGIRISIQIESSSKQLYNAAIRNNLQRENPLVLNIQL